jgi:hypothetical protein
MLPSYMTTITWDSFFDNRQLGHCHKKAMAGGGYF